MPPKSRSSTLVAFEAEASSKVDPVSVAPFEGMSPLVVGGGGEALAVEATNGTTNELTASPRLTKKAAACNPHRDTRNEAVSRERGSPECRLLAAHLEGVLHAPLV